jgi:hypothetical protein
MLREIYLPAYRPRSERPAPHPVFVPRESCCLECGSGYWQTAAVQNACPGECRERRAARAQLRRQVRRRRRQLAEVGV